MKWLNKRKMQRECEFCNCKHPVSDKSADIRIIYTNILHVDYDQMVPDLFFNIKYCPMCGRKLEVEDD